MQRNINGLDMGPTIAWYETNKGLLLPLSETAMPLKYPVEGEEHIHLSAAEMAGLFYMLPNNAVKRSTLRKIKGNKQIWFHKDSKAGSIITTADVTQALSPTAIIPSYTDNSDWKEDSPASGIVLYRIGDDICSVETRKIVHAEGLLHETAHTLIHPAIYLDRYMLVTPNGRTISGFDFVMRFAEMAERKQPISQYASFYRGADGKFPNASKEALTAISEELAETIAAYFLDFAFCGDDKRSKEPFADRQEIRELVYDFLNARLAI